MTNLTGDFSIEAADWFNYWLGYITSGNSNSSQDNAVFYVGANSYKIVASGGVTDSGRYQDIVLRLGRYHFSGFVKTGASVTNAHCLIHDSGFNVLAGGHVTTANQDWTEESGDFTVTVAGTYTVRIGLGSFGSASDGTANFDNITLSRYDPGFKTNYLRPRTFGPGLAR